MKFKTLKVKNFKNIAEKEFELSKFNLLYGENGSGKSSILAAFRFLLNGDLPKDAIREGENELSVCAYVDDENNTQLGRFTYRPEEFQINGISVKDTVFFQRVREACASYQTSTYSPKPLERTHRYFMDKDPGIFFSFLETGTVDGTRLSGVKELEIELEDGTSLYRRASRQNRVEINGRKCTIAAFNKALDNYGIRDTRALDIVTSSEMMEKLGMAEFGKYLLQNLPVKIDFDKLSDLANLSDEEKEALRPLFPPSPEVITIDCVEKVYGQVFNTRAMINANAKAELQKSIFEGEIPTRKRDDVLHEIAEANRSLGERKSLEMVHVNYNRIMQTRKQLMDQEASLKEKLKDPRFDGLTQPDANLQKSLQESEKTMYDARQVAYNNFYSLKKTVQLHKDAVAALDSNQCPVYKGLTCSTDRHSYRDELVRLANEASQGVIDAQAAYKEANRILAETTEKKEKVANQMRLWEEKCTIEGKLKLLASSIPEEPEKPQELLDTTKINEKLLALNDLLPAINAYEESLKAKDRYENVMKQFALYDGLVKKTNPKNGLLMSVIMQQVIAPFEAHCSELATAIYSDCEIKFSITETGLTALYKPHGKDCYLSPDTLSTGEKMQLTFILMDLVSTISGSRILVFDNLEALDKDSLLHLVQLVESKELKDRYDHILFAVVDHNSIMDDLSSIGCIQKVHMV